MKINHYWITIVIISMVFIDNLFSQKLVGKYESVNIFSGLTKPISVGIVRFDGDIQIEEQLLEEIGNVTSVRENFIFYPAQTLESLKEDLSIENLNIFDLNVLNKLKENLDIQLVLVGEIEANHNLQIDLVNTENGDTVFTNVYKPSKNSTPLEDIIKLFTEWKTAIYKREIKNLPEMIFVEKGEIEVGDRYKKDTISVYNDFFISKYECSIKQFAEFIDATGYKTDAEKDLSDRIRVEGNDEKMTSENLYNNDSLIKISDEFYNDIAINISWNDAVAYCDWLSQESGEKFRLAYEDEWRFAASLFDYREYTKYLIGNDNFPKIVSGEFRFIQENIEDWVIVRNKKYSVEQTLGVEIISNLESFLKSKLVFKRPNLYSTNISFRIVKEIN